VAVEAFLKGNIRFTEIPDIIDSALSNMPVETVSSVSGVVMADEAARYYTEQLIAKIAKG